MPSASKYLLLVPLRYNDGRLVPPQVVLYLEEKLFELADGYTIGGLRTGAYRMADGTRTIDETIEYWVVIPDDCFPELERLVAVLGRDLGQEAMYLEKTDSEVFFVRPAKTEEEGSGQ
jgi:hypothetical protein